MSVELKKNIDSKKYLWLAGLWVLATPVVAISLTHLTSLSIFLWFGPLNIFLFAPILEFIMGTDSSNPSEDEFDKISQDPYYIRLLYGSVLTLFASFFYTIYYISSHSLDWTSTLALAFSTGGAMGVAINLAHELGHKSKSFPRWMAKLTLAPVFYGHFYVEHNRGHHVRVATHEDPASARRGENAWIFVARSVSGSVVSSLNIEEKRLKKMHRSVWSLRNEVFHSWLMTAVLWGGILAFAGIKMLPFLIIQALYGITLLEVINYVEHYGLQRRKLKNGRYESCQIHHSWNSNSLMSNIFLYQLQRHADHHANPQRPYQSLRHFEDSPQLPWGYGVMMLVALCPPFWFKIMNPLVDEYYTKANTYHTEENEKAS
ncbi:MAG: alkane 1-monooxygenase [Bacteriovorax sp.]|nr:alkane 1-monooxygenase [Bacteriovorax sp.]